MEEEQNKQTKTNQTFHKVQYLFVIKTTTTTLNKLGIAGNFLKFINGIYGKTKLLSYVIVKDLVLFPQIRGTR